MSATYYFIKDREAKAPYLKIKDKIDYYTWVDIMEEYDIVWDINTNHGKYYLKIDPESHYKRQAYFDYKELKEGIGFSAEDQVIKTGSYSFFMAFNKESGVAFAQFYKRERKHLLPLLFELSEKLDCYLIKDTKKIITKKDLDNL